MSTRSKVPAGFGLTGAARSMAELLEWIAKAVRHGFSEIQLHIQWSPILPNELEAIERVLASSRLRCRSIGIYNDLMLRDNPHFAGTTERDLRQIVDWMGAIQAESVVSWAGSYNDDLLGSDPRNSSREARVLLTANLERLEPLLKKHRVRLLVEPWQTHVLAAEEELADFCAEHGASVGVVIDVANLVSPKEWQSRNERIDAIVTRLSPVCGLVHLKDMKVAADGSFELPYCGMGGIDFERVLSRLQPLWRKVPFMIEHVSSDADISGATGHVLSCAKNAGYDLA